MPKKLETETRPAARITEETRDLLTFRRLLGRRHRLDRMPKNSMEIHNLCQHHLQQMTREAFKVMHMNETNLKKKKPLKRDQLK
jgi:hypothetical protein